MLNMNTININHIKKGRNRTPAPKTRTISTPSPSRINKIFLEIGLNEELTAGQWSDKCGLLRSDFFNVVKPLVLGGYVTKRKETGPSGRIETFFTRVKSEHYEASSYA